MTDIKEYMPLMADIGTGDKMKLTIDIPRTFDITLEQMDVFLTSNGWNEKTVHDESAFSYQSIKYSNICVILPRDESVIDCKFMVHAALLIIADMNDDCGIETIVKRVNRSLSYVDH